MFLSRTSLLHQQQQSTQLCRPSIEEAHSHIDICLDTRDKRTSARDTSTSIRDEHARPVHVVHTSLRHYPFRFSLHPLPPPRPVPTRDTVGAATRRRGADIRRTLRIGDIEPLKKPVVSDTIRVHACLARSTGALRLLRALENSGKVLQIQL